jgi:hypothetical protein
MPCCCEKILELCRVSLCGTDLIKTGIIAPSTGVYKLILDYLKVSVVISKAIAEDQPVDFPSNDLNEQYKYRGKVYGPDGEPLTITIGEDEYDCITFQTGMQYPMNEVTCPAIDASEWELPDTELGAEYYVELPLNGSGPYSADLISQPSWMAISIVDNKIVLSGTVPTGEEHIDSVPVTIRASNCARELPDLGDPTFSQVINVTAAS